MTAQELSDNLQAASLAQFGDTGVAMYPEGWWDHNVFVIAPDGTQTQRAPKYCATPAAATVLAQLFGAKAIVLGCAINFTGLLDSWSDTKLVPYLQFEGAALPVNAGTLLDYFNHGYPADKAYNDALAEIKGAK